MSNLTTRTYDCLNDRRDRFGSQAFNDIATKAPKEVNTIVDLFLTFFFSRLKTVLPQAKGAISL